MRLVIDTDRSGRDCVSRLPTMSTPGVGPEALTACNDTVHVVQQARNAVAAPLPELYCRGSATPGVATQQSHILGISARPARWPSCHDNIRVILPTDNDAYVPMVQAALYA
ncbi:hypothetical protein Q4543_21725 [Salipiger sp. 1_MG-2023]|uniref:hypothetical protein n=1 Tax=Salipiger sp. 1_MG-2023 TaxID=3062665 RepID=UPI0026E3BA08|nr:hypothetical protein [Salipiger sp. 1_MG-2023]MDO6588127.1 hypothetical protein [Salipiger sp. 1_MG-2023]